MDLHDMKRTRKERKDNSPEVAPTNYDEPEYPYGMEISLDAESMKKLGLDVDDFSIDGEVDIICQGEVTRTHESSGKHDSTASVSIQITKMAMRPKPNEEKVTLKDVMSVIKGGL